MQAEWKCTPVNPAIAPPGTDLVYKQDMLDSIVAFLPSMKFRMRQSMQRGALYNCAISHRVFNVDTCVVGAMVVMFLLKDA